MVKPKLSKRFGLQNVIFTFICIFYLINVREISGSLEQRVQFLIKNYLSNCEVIYSEDISSKGRTPTNLLSISTVRYILDLSLYYPEKQGSYRYNLSTRKFSQCFMVLTVLNEGTRYLEKFAKIFIQDFGSPTKSDEDYYVFIASPRDIQPILDSSTAKLIKFKLVIPNPSSTYFIGYSFRFYCTPTPGQSQAVKINLMNSTYLLQDIFPDFTVNGNAYIMRTTSPTKYKFTTEIQEISGKWELVRGISKSIMDVVVHHYNFTYVVFSSPNGDTGGVDKNGSWNGCIGQLISGEAELSLTTSANHARFPVIAFSTAAFYAWVSFTVGPAKITYSWQAIFWSFKKELWLAVTASTILVILVFKLFAKFDTVRTQGRSSFYKTLTSDIVFTLIGKNVREPEAIYTRILLCWWLLSALIINSLYTSKIVGLLAQPIYESPPRTFEDLADSKFSVGMDFSGGSLYAYFQTSASPIFQKIFSKFEQPKETVSCFETATRRSFACITWNGVADYIGWRNFTIVNGQSPFLRATDVTYFVPCGLAMPRNAVFKPNFDKTISMIYDTGHGNRWIMDDLEELQRKLLRWQREELNKTVVRYGDNGPVMLKLSNILGVFYIFGVGHSIAVFGLLGEKLVVRPVPRSSLWQGG